MLEQSIESVLQEEKDRYELIEEAQKPVNEKLRNLDAALDMVAVEVKQHIEDGSRRGKARFVKFFPDMLRECEKVLGQKNNTVGDMKNTIT